jgi:hypothetical protein
MANLAASFDLGDGNDTLAIQRSDFTAGLSVAAGAGADRVSLDHVNAGAALSVNMGAGDDKLSVSNSTADAGTTATFDGGGGANDVLTPNANTFASESDVDFDMIV